MSLLGLEKLRPGGRLSADDIRRLEKEWERTAQGPPKIRQELLAPPDPGEAAERWYDRPDEPLELPSDPAPVVHREVKGGVLDGLRYTSQVIYDPDNPLIEPSDHVQR